VNSVFDSLQIRSNTISAVEVMHNMVEAIKNKMPKLLS
jgi:hypothetical protein